MARGVNWTLVLGLGAAAGVLYLLKKGGDIGKSALDTVSTDIANAYLALTLGPPVQVAGSVDDAAGNVLGPIASFPSAHDDQGNTYLAIQGFWYQLGPRDARGNFTAVATGQAVTQ